jgi:hypothetical protein
VHADNSHQTVDWEVQFQNMCAEKEQPTPRRLTTADTYELLDAMRQDWRLSHREAGNLILWLDPDYVTAVPVTGKKAHTLAMKNYNTTKKERKATLDSGRRRNKRKASPSAARSKSIASRAFLRTTASLEARLATGKETQRIQRDVVKKQKLQLKETTADAVQLRKRLSDVSHERKELKAGKIKNNQEIRQLQTAARAEPSARAQRVQKKGKP